MERERGTVQRRAEIAQLLQREGAVGVGELAARFGVSAPTIRRDLGWLVSQGLARRARGGALVAGGEAATASANTLPARIGRAAAGMVQEGETVFLSPGLFSLGLARALAGRKQLTVVTNGLAVAQEIAEHTLHTLILTGGQLEREEQGLAGRLTLAALEELRADRVFLELSGVSAVAGLTDDSLPQAELARLLLSLGGQVIVLVAPERVGRVAAAYVGPVSEADVVVTGREADSAPLWDLAEAGVRVVLA